MKIYDIPCPECGAERTTKDSSYASLCRKNHKRCKACYSLEMSVKFSGEGNPFYGKKHSAETIKNKIANTDYSFTRTDEFRNAISKRTSGSNNPMSGKKIYDIWVEKYGVDEAELRKLDFSAKRKAATTGCNNPMFGKPAPKKAGSGWKGWYRDWFFRSLRELSYMVNVIEVDGIKWECGEQKKYAVIYEIAGKQRNYFPDFVLNDIRVVEIKPRKLFNTSINEAKRAAATIQYANINMTYEMVDVDALLTTFDLRSMINDGTLIFDSKTLEKFEKYEKT